jgi:atypical dual specificity phosphatase
MSQPDHFTWIDQPKLSASAYPQAAEELTWLRKQGIDILMSLTEDPVRRDWVDNAGLMSVHIPIEDFEAPSPEQFDLCLSVIERANESNMGVHIHCRAGAGRTGTVLAAYFIRRGLPATDAIERIRELRPGSVETPEQERALREYARRLGNSEE